MKKAIACWTILLGIALAPLGIAIAQIGPGGPGGANVGVGTSFDASIDASLYGTAAGQRTSGSTPVTVTALTGCVTGGSPTVAGNEQALMVTAGTTTSTTCTITWPKVRNNAPVCAITGHTAAAGLPSTTVESTTALTWTWPTTTVSTIWDVICFGT